MDFSDQYGSFSKASIGEAMELDVSAEDITQWKRASADWRTLISLPEMPTPTSRFKQITDSDKKRRATEKEADRGKRQAEDSDN